MNVGLEHQVQEPVGLGLWYTSRPSSHTTPCH